MSEQKEKKTFKKFEIDKFLECANEIVNKEDTDRAWAWYDCYAAFQSNNLDNDTKAKELFIYLANWGMLRNSFLMNCTWRVLREVVEEISNTKLTIPKNTTTIKKDDSFITGVDNLYTEINKKLKETLKNVKGIEKDVSSRLITKIILGTTGYTVAYDTYVRSALSMISHMKNAPKLTGAGGYTKNSVTSLYNFYFDNKDKFDEKLNKINKNESHPKWTIMRFIDSCLLGYWEQNGKDFKKWKTINYPPKKRNKKKK